MKQLSIIMIMIGAFVVCNADSRKLDDVGVCENGVLNDNDICECFSGFVGEFCNYICPGTDIVASSEACYGNGVCELNEGGDMAICKCQNDLFLLPDCRPKCPGNRVENSNVIQCNGHGICGEDGKCKCDFGYYGESCTSSCPGLILIDGSLKECSGNGRCNRETLKCECISDVFDQTTCAGTCNGIDTCNNRGICNTSGICDCVEGWSGPYCNIPCSRETCNNHGECVDDLCLCDPSYSGEYCETKTTSFVGLIVLLVIVNVVVAFMWYKQTHKTVFERKLPDQFNPEQLAARRQRELEQVQSLTRPAPTATLPTAVATINKPADQWTCPACTFSNPGTTTKCVVCNTEKGTVIEKPKPEETVPSDEEEVSIKRTRKSAQRSTRTTRRAQAASESEKDIPEVDLLPEDTTEPETELFKNDEIRICLVMKKFEENPHLFNLLYRYYALKEPLSEVAITTSVPKYITVKSHPISSSTIDLEKPATQQLVVLVNEDKPLKLRLSGSVKMHNESLAIQSGGLSIM